MKPAVPFAHLHVHSAYSLLDGLCRLPELAEAVRALGMDAVAVTDHDALFGAYEFSDAARSAGVRAVFGCELAVEIPGGEGPFPMVLLAETLAGFGALQRILSLAHARGPPPVLRIEELDAHRGALLGLSGSWPQSAIARLCGEDRAGEAARLAGTLAETLGAGHFFLELQNHGLAGQQRANAGLRALGRRLGLEPVVTHNVHYLKDEDAEAHLLLQCLQAGVPWRERARVRAPTPGMALRGPEAMAEAFPGDGPARARAAELAERCAFELPRSRPFTFPAFPVPPAFRPESGKFRLELEYLRSLALEGLRRVGRGADPDRTARLDAELSLIGQAGYARVLLALGDLAAVARSRGFPPGPGRGTLVSSLTAYALGVTGVDPLAHGLVFERWLNPAVSEAPELGLEVSPAGRAGLIRALSERYGPERLAHLVTFSTLGPRQALRDAGRVLELEPDRVAALLRRLAPGAASLAGLSWPDADGPETLALGLARRIEGLPRNAGTHPSGLVLSGAPLSERVPVAPGAGGVSHAMVDHRYLGRAGLLKLDLYGSRTLQAVEILAGRGAVFDREAIPPADPEVFARLEGDEGGGIVPADLRELLGRLRPRSLGDLALALALHRPAPPVSVAELILRREDPRAARPPDPLLRGSLEETSGVFLYEEQWIAAARSLAGLSDGTADRLLRAAAARSAETRRARAVLREGIRRVCRVHEPRAAALSDILLESARPLLSKASVLAPALMLCRAAWLALRMPREFLSARITAEPGPGRRLSELLAAARRLGLVLRPPDVNASGAGFEAEDGELRFGLSAIRHIGPDTARALLAERERAGPYSGFLDFCRRQDPAVLTHRALDALIRSGALDGLGETRARMAACAPAILEGAAALRKDLDAGQGLLFRPSEIVAAPGAGPGDEWPEEKKRRDELELLGG